MSVWMLVCLYCALHVIIDKFSSVSNAHFWNPNSMAQFCDMCLNPAVMMDSIII